MQNNNPKCFLGIGSSHLDNVFDFIYYTLARYAPQAITLEHPQLLIDEIFLKKKNGVRYRRGIGKVVCNPINNLGVEEPKIIHENVKKTFLYIGKERVIDGGELELTPAIDYALDQKIPFYFIDNPLGNSKGIIEFKMNKFKVISLEKEIIHTKNTSVNVVDMDDMINRNKFAADAINYLFRQEFSKIAHIGGAAHFNNQYFLSDRWPPYDSEFKNHIQDFLDANKIVIADSNTNKTYHLKL